MGKVLRRLAILLLLISLALGGIAIPMDRGQWLCAAWPWCDPLYVIAAEYAVIGGRDRVIDEEKLTMSLRGEPVTVLREQVWVFGGAAPQTKDLEEDTDGE